MSSLGHVSAVAVALPIFSYLSHTEQEHIRVLTVTLINCAEYHSLVSSSVNFNLPQLRDQIIAIEAIADITKLLNEEALVHERLFALQGSGLPEELKHIYADVVKSIRLISDNTFQALRLQREQLLALRA